MENYQPAFAGPSPRSPVSELAKLFDQAASGKAAEFTFTHSRLHDEGRSHEAGWTEALDNWSVAS
jgi:hypothetical protein